MIFFLGFLSLIQIVFLPGLIIIRLFKLKNGVIQALVYAFGLSLIFNSLWIFLITIFKINYPEIHYGLFIIEIILAIYLHKDSLFQSSDSIAKNLKRRWKETLDMFFSFFRNDLHESELIRLIKSVIIIIVFAWALSSLYWLLQHSIDNLDKVFNEWDAVVSWNRWAVEWFNGIIPSPKRYPQLIPSNFSITYSFLKATEIQFFAKAFMPLFTVFTWLMFLDLSFEYQNPGILFGLVIQRYITNEFFLTYISEGYVDLALMFFAFLVVYTILKSKDIADKKSKSSYLYLGAIFSAGSALAKSNGLLIMAFYPVLAIDFTGVRQNKNLLYGQLKNILKPLIVGIAILLPWYVYNETQILLGNNFSNVAKLIGAERHSDRSYFERAVRAIEMLKEYVYLFPFALFSLPFIPKQFKKISVLMIFPYSLIWLFFFSIFERNLAMAFPFLALTAGLGVDYLSNFVLGLLERIKFNRIRAFLWLIPLIFILSISSFLITDEELQNKQFEEQKNVLIPPVNKKLYRFFDEREEYGVIMTAYRLNYLPILDEYFIQDEFIDYEETYEKFESNPEIEYFLVWERLANQDVLDILDDMISEDLLVMQFSYNSLKFYEVVDREAILEYTP